MSEANQYRKSNQANSNFENRNFNRQNQTNSIAQKPISTNQTNASRPQASSKYVGGNSATQTIAAAKEAPSSHAAPSRPANSFVKPAAASLAFRDKIAIAVADVEDIKAKLDLDIPERTSEALVIEKLSKSKAINIQITERDFAIMEFILEMKFASEVEIFEKFFSVLKNNQPAKNSIWTLKRLTHLETAGFLKGYLRAGDTKKYFCATERAYLVLHQKVQMEKIPRPKTFLENNVFVHDWLVLKSRMEFEKHNPGCEWISDRKLRAGIAQMFNLPSAYIPDAIYELSSGERVAFELENAPKGRGAYREKIRYFAKLMDLKFDEPQMFRRVRFRCVRPDVQKILNEETSLYPGKFTVEMWDSPFAKEGGGSVPVPKYLITAHQTQSSNQDLEAKT